MEAVLAILRQRHDELSAAHTRALASPLPYGTGARIAVQHALRADEVLYLIYLLEQESSPAPEPCL